jgi:hypothetical protein
MPQLMPVQIAANQFAIFREFAEEKLAEGKEKAIARLDNPAQIDGHLSSCIKAATDDRVYAIRRSADNKKANNDVRALFMDSVKGIFEGNIPEPVKKAMMMNDYNKGRPLTARRIMAVNDAIYQVLKEKEEQAIKEKEGQAIKEKDEFERQKTIHEVTNIATMREARKGFGFRGIGDVTLGYDSQRALDLYTRLADPLYLPKGSPLLEMPKETIFARSVMAFLADPKTEPQAETHARRIYQELLPVRKFAPGDSRAEELDSAVAEYVKSLIKERVRPDNNPHLEGSEEIFSETERAVTTLLHRKFLADILLKIPSAVSLALVHQGTGADEGLSLQGVEGANMVVGGSFTHGIDHVDHKLDISPDGKKATLTTTHDGTLGLPYQDTEKGQGDFTVGKFTMTQVFSFDLSHDEPVLTGYHLGQTFS